MTAQEAHDNDVELLCENPNFQTWQGTLTPRGLELLFEFDWQLEQVGPDAPAYEYWRKF